MTDFHRNWIEQCDAAQGIRERYGIEKALGYLIGEKLMNYVRAAEKDADFAGELPAFVARIREDFEPHELRAYLDDVRRVGAPAHTLSKEQYEFARDAVRRGERRPRGRGPDPHGADPGDAAGVSQPAMQPLAVAATAQDKRLLSSLLDQYLAEIREHRQVQVGAVDARTYPYLDAYWIESGRHPFLILWGNVIAGFALVRGPASTGTEATQMAEFFVQPEERRRGIGKRAAVQLFRLFGGEWELQVHSRNVAATKFWAAVIAEVSDSSAPPFEVPAPDGLRLQFNFFVPGDWSV